MLVQSARVGMGRFREGVRVRDFPLHNISCNDSVFESVAPAKSSFVADQCVVYD